MPAAIFGSSGGLDSGSAFMFCNLFPPLFPFITMLNFNNYVFIVYRFVVVMVFSYLIVLSLILLVLVYNYNFKMHKCHDYHNHTFMISG